MQDPSQRPFDVALYGATGFTGRRAARELLQQGPVDLRLLLAGRDPKRLAALGRELELPFRVADCRQLASMAALAREARVVASTAGPFARYSDALVDACVEHGTHWCDLTGETAWVRRLIDRHHDRAATEGTRVVPFCGFDSIPSDTALARLTREAQERWGEDLQQVSVAWSLRGGINGGSVATALDMGEREDVRTLADPLLLVPRPAGSQPARAGLRDPGAPFTLPRSERLLAPFVMGPINARVIRRSRHLAGLDPAALLYREGLDLGGGRWRTAAATWGLAGFALALRSGVGRRLVRALAPAPGEGPAQARVSGGHTRGLFHARTVGAHELLLRLDADGDAGNAVTVRCLAQAALLLARQAHSDAPGGVLTPAAAFGARIEAALEGTGAHRVDVQVLPAGA